MGSHDEFAPELPLDAAPGPPRPPRPPGVPRRQPWHASGRARFLVGGFAVLDVAIVAIVVILAGQTLLASASGPKPSPTPSPTGAPTTIAIASSTASPTLTPGPTPTPKPTQDPTRPLPASQLTGYVWPMDAAVVTLPFGPSTYGEFIVNGKLFHDGLDMAMAVRGGCGAKVMAAHDGTVLTAGRDYADFMGWQGDLGAYKKKVAPASWKISLPIVVVIDDGNGYRSIYAHESRVTVKAGQKVKAGQVIGSEGMTGGATGCHLHFGLYSTLETATFANVPHAMTVLHLPATETARIDPLLVLPYRDDVTEMHALRPADAAAWASAHPSASPTD
jgi:murein DD-endopeptidase MepM/ murein hydrolase activator NlpD